MMNSWMWKSESPKDYALDAVEIWTAYASGQKVAVVAHEVCDDEPSLWATYMVLTQAEDGFAGLEAIDGFETLAAAQASIDADREALLRIVNEG